MLCGVFPLLLWTCTNLCVLYATCASLVRCKQVMLACHECVSAIHECVTMFQRRHHRNCIVPSRCSSEIGEIGTRHHVFIGLARCYGPQAFPDIHCRVLCRPCSTARFGTSFLCNMPPASCASFNMFGVPAAPLHTILLAPAKFLFHRADEMPDSKNCAASASTQ